MAPKQSVRATTDFPQDTYRALREQARLQGCSVRELVLRGVDAVLLKPEPLHPTRVQFPLLPPSKEKIELSNEQLYELIEFP